MKETRDLWFGGFLLMKGFTIADYKKKENKGIFIFDISEEDWKKCKLEFNQSNISELKWSIEKLKDLIF